MLRVKSPWFCYKFISNISDTFTAEAHVRLELWLALSKRNYRHTPPMDEQVGRRRKWKQLAQMANKDRRDNADAAHELRLKRLPVSTATEEDADAARADSPLPESFYE
jgi:hypothetical protein